MNSYSYKSELDYSIEVDEFDRESWDKIISNFKDASIYQTWEYGSQKWGDENISHLVLKKQNQIVAATQVQVVKIPFFSQGVAYITWGPLYKLHRQNNCLENFSAIISALKHEYVINRNLFLRILPNIFDNDENSEEILTIFQDEDFEFSNGSYQTYLVDLKQSNESLLNRIKRGWRKNLKRAMRNDLKIISGVNGNLFDTVNCLYNEMLGRKKFKSDVDVNLFKTIQSKLPEYLKLRIFICEHCGDPIAALVGSSIGKWGIELVAASGDKGLDLRGSYLLHWEMAKWLRRMGCEYYDLSQINQIHNPGSFQFKSGFAGKDSEILRKIGVFDSYNDKKTKWIFRSTDFFRRKLKYIHN